MRKAQRGESICKHGNPDPYLCMDCRNEPKNYDDDDEQDQIQALTKERDQYRRLLDDLAKRVIPGEIDSADAVMEVVQERDEALAKVKRLLHAIEDAKREANKHHKHCNACYINDFNLGNTLRFNKEQG
jgi:hypothetical protein